MIETIRKLEIRDGDVVCLPADTSLEEVKALRAALGPDGFNIRCMLVLGDVQSLDEPAMNAAGWYRK